MDVSHNWNQWINSPFDPGETERIPKTETVTVTTSTLEKGLILLITISLLNEDDMILNHDILSFSYKILILTCERTVGNRLIRTFYTFI